MSPNEKKERWHYLAAKKLSALLHRIIVHKGNFYCLNYIHFFRKGKN